MVVDPSPLNAFTRQDDSLISQSEKLDLQAAAESLGVSWVEFPIEDFVAFLHEECGLSDLVPTLSAGHPTTREPESSGDSFRMPLRIASGSWLRRSRRVDRCRIAEFFTEISDAAHGIAWSRGSRCGWRRVPAPVR